MFVELLMIIIGFVLLIVGANFLVKGASNIAKRFNIPEILIGLTIVAIGTSAPELIITITSAQKGMQDLILGDAIGSNLCNLLLVLGINSIIKPIKIDKEATKLHIPILFAITCVMLAVGKGLFSNTATINKAGGVVFVILFIIYFSYPIIIELEDIIKAYKKKNKTIGNEGYLKSLLIPTVIIVLGMILLKYGGDIVVEHSTNIANMLNISQQIIGLTVVAFGTSLPELATSIIAVIKGEEDLAVGNLVGSCVFNFLLILGIGAILTPLQFSYKFNQELLLLLISILLIWIFNFIGKKNYITRIKGSILVIIFSVYIFNLIN